jgi:hypothetical protein
MKISTLFGSRVIISGAAHLASFNIEVYSRPVPLKKVRAVSLDTEIEVK